MRVVIVSDFGLVNGGAAKVAIGSARALADAGVDIVFAFAVGPASYRLKHPKIRLECFDGRDIWTERSRGAAARRGIWNAQAGAFVADLLARQPPGTIVHFHQWTKVFSPATIAAAVRSGLPLFVTVHDYFSFCPVGGYFDFQAAKPCSRVPMSMSCIARNCDRTSYGHKLVRVARQWLFNRALASSRNLTFVHVSDYARRFSERFLPRHAGHVTIENMTDVPVRPPVDVSANRHALFLGRFTPEKAPDLLAAAAWGTAMPVRFVGEGPRADMIKAANPQAEMRDWASADEVLAELSAARCLVVPSIWFETGPLVIAEARSIGVPVILSRTTGAASWVNDGEDGILVDAGDVAQLSAALEALQDDERVRRMGQAAYRRYWSDPLSVERHADRTIAAYMHTTRSSTPPG